jgi:hypothetical protein
VHLFSLNQSKRPAAAYSAIKKSLVQPTSRVIQGIAKICEEAENRSTEEKRDGGRLVLDSRAASIFDYYYRDHGQWSLRLQKALEQVEIKRAQSVRFTGNVAEMVRTAGAAEIEEMLGFARDADPKSRLWVLSVLPTPQTFAGAKLPFNFQVLLPDKGGYVLLSGTPL